MVDVIATVVSGREKMAQALQRFVGLEEPGALPKSANSRRPRPAWTGGAWSIRGMTERPELTSNWQARGTVRNTP